METRAGTETAVSGQGGAGSGPCPGPIQLLLSTDTPPPQGRLPPRSDSWSSALQGQSPGRSDGLGPSKAGVDEDARTQGAAELVLGAGAVFRVASDKISKVHGERGLGSPALACPGPGPAPGSTAW